MGVVSEVSHFDDLTELARSKLLFKAVKAVHRDILSLQKKVDELMSGFAHIQAAIGAAISAIEAVSTEIQDHPANEDGSLDDLATRLDQAVAGLAATNQQVGQASSAGVTDGSVPGDANQTQQQQTQPDSGNQSSGDAGASIGAGDSGVTADSAGFSQPDTGNTDTSGGTSESSSSSNPGFDPSAAAGPSGE